MNHITYKKVKGVRNNWEALKNTIKGLWTFGVYFTVWLFFFLFQKTIKKKKTPQAKLHIFIGFIVLQFYRTYHLVWSHNWKVFLSVKKSCFNNTLIFTDIEPSILTCSAVQTVSFHSQCFIYMCKTPSNLKINILTCKLQPHRLHNTLVSKV